MTDASVWVAALVDGPRRDPALRALAGLEPWAPQLVDAEVVSALARLERGGELTGPEAEAAAEDWLLARVERVEDEGLVADAWALRHALRVSDAFYAALARALEVPLVTSDGRLARAPLGDVTVLLVR